LAARIKSKAQEVESCISHPFDFLLGFARSFGKTGQALSKIRKGMGQPLLE
jgi:hypothetical protein